MNFTLTYEGDLKPKKDGGDRQHKHEIRRKFHHQLVEFWKASTLHQGIEVDGALITAIGKYRFFPLVSIARHQTAELQVTMLRPQRGPGYIVGQGGDIDNRLKTLFDSLTMPKKNEIPPQDLHRDNEDPFFCLLENDILITDLSVATDRLLEPCQSDSHVKLVIRVQTKTVCEIGANMILTLG